MLVTLLAISALTVLPQDRVIQQVAPGVTKVDGSKVVNHPVDMAALQQALIDRKAKVRDFEKLIGTKGQSFGGPVMFSVADKATCQAYLLMLFVERGKVVDALLSEKAEGTGTTAPGSCEASPTND